MNETHIEADTSVEPDDGRAWYIVQTYSGYENKVKTSLEQRVKTMDMGGKIFQVIIPTEEEIEIKDGQRKKVSRKLFPGYVFVQMIMADDAWYVVRNTPAVTGFAGATSDDRAKPTPLPDAEKLKRRAGCALASMILDDEMIEVPSVGGRPPRTFARRSVAEFLQPRGEELFHLVWDEICTAGYERHLNAGLVLTGGGANLYGMADLAEHIFKMPVRVGVPEHVGRLSDHLATAEFSTGVGLVLYGYQRLTAGGMQPRHRPGVAGVWDRCTDAFRKWR